MKQEINFKIWTEWLIAIGLGLFFISPKSSSLVVVLLIILTGFAIAKKQVSFVFEPLFLAFILFYLAYVVGAIATHHPNEAFHYFERKLSLLLFPLIFSFRYKEPLDLRKITLGMVGGALAVFVLGVIHSTQIYKTTHDFNNSFGSVSFSYIHHPTYLAAMTTIVLLFVREGYKQKWKGFSIYFLLGCFILTSLTLLFCFSFAGILFFMLVFAVVILKWIYQRVNRGVFVFFMVLIPLIPILAYKSNIHVQIEMDEAFIDLKNYLHDPEHVYVRAKENGSGNNIRLLMWTVSTQEFLAHPFGAGTANVDDVLAARLKIHDLDEIASRNLNPHNQYLQVAVEIGIVGLLLFLSIFYLAFKKAKMIRSSVLFWLTLSLLFNSLFESMLQRQSGVVFYTFVICLLSVYPKMKVQENEEVILNQK